MAIDYSSKFTNSRGVYLTKALFVDFVFTGGDTSQCLYTLRPFDDPRGFPSLGRLYLEAEDLTEYEFATKYFANWEHWQLVVNTTFMRDIIDTWRKELELRIRAKALREIIQTADPLNGSRNYYEANKFLVTGGWLNGEEKKEAAKRGRPRKDEIRQKAVAEFVENAEQLESDLRRLASYEKNKSPN